MFKDVMIGHYAVIHDEEHADTDSHYGTGFYTFSRNDFRNGSSVHNFRDRIARHESAMSSYARWIDNRFTLSPGQLSGRFDIADYRPGIPFTTATVSSIGCHAAIAVDDFRGPIYGDLSTQARNQLNVKFLLKLKSKSDQLSGGTFLGEFAETLHELRHPAASLRRGIGNYLSVVNKRLKGVRKSLKPSKRVRAANDIIAGSWLEFSFGWKPLVADCEDGLAAYNSFFDVNEFVGEKVSATISETTFNRAISEGYHTPDGYLGFDVIISNETLFSGRMFGFVMRETPRPYTALRHLGLAPEDFIPTLWELLPFSFLADYFVNIGNCLAAGGVSTSGLRWLGLTNRNRYKYSYLSRSNSYLTDTYQGGGFGNASITSKVPSSVEGEAFELVRQVLDPQSDLWVIPTITLPTQPNRFANMLSLITQASSIRKGFI